MRALRFERFGEPGDVLKLEDVPTAEAGPGQVRIRLTHRAINPSDLYTLRGTYGHLPRLPATPGFEGMGRVDAIGRNAGPWQAGDRVIPLAGDGGTWREYTVADATRLIPVATGVSDQTAAQFVVNPVTAWVMLEEVLEIRPGDWVLQTAAASTLGRLVIQLAQLRGYKTINLVRRAEQVAELLALGADAALCAGVDDVTARVQELTGGTGVKGALEAVGGETGALALRCLRPGGVMVVYGMLSDEPLPVHNGELLFRGLTLRGFWLSHWFRAQPAAHVATTLAKLMGLMAEGRLIPPVEAEYDLAEYRPAIAHAERPGRQGKVLLTG